MRRSPRGEGGKRRREGGKRRGNRTKTRKSNRE